MEGMNDEPVEEFLVGLTLAELREAFDLFLARSIPNDNTPEMQERIWSAFVDVLREKCTIEVRSVGPA